MKKLFNLILLLCLGAMSMAQQRPDYQQTKTSQVLSNWSGKYTKSLTIPKGDTPGFPAWVADSSKCGALFIKTGGTRDTLMSYDCAGHSWLAVNEIKQIGDNTFDGQNSFNGVLDVHGLLRGYNGVTNAWNISPSGQAMFGNLFKNSVAVLNQTEGDARWGQLGANNNWSGTTNTFDGIVGSLTTTSVGGHSMQISGSDISSANNHIDITPQSGTYARVNGTFIVTGGTDVQALTVNETLTLGKGIQIFDGIAGSNIMLSLEQKLSSQQIRFGVHSFIGSPDDASVVVIAGSAGFTFKGVDLVAPDGKYFAKADSGFVPAPATGGSYLSKAGGTVTGDIILPNTVPTNADQAVPKFYIDNLITGITWKNAVNVKTTGNVTLSGLQTIDGVAGGTYRVLVNDQSDPKQNGIYDEKSTSWTRVVDADTGDEISMATVAVTKGTLNKNTQWTCTNATVPTIGTDNITFGQISGAGTYTNGVGVDLTANAFSLNTAYARGLFTATAPILYNNTTGVLSIQQATTSQPGYLSSTDWNAFNGKQNAISMTTGQIGYWNGSTLVGSANYFWDATNNRLGIGTNSPLSMLHVASATLPVNLIDNTIGKFISVYAGASSAGLSFDASGTFVIQSQLQANKGLATGGTIQLFGNTTGFTFGNAIPTHTLTLALGNTGIVNYNNAAGLDNGVTNYERVRQYWSTNTFLLSAEMGGTGLVRDIAIGALGTPILNVSNTGANGAFVSAVRATTGTTAGFATAGALSATTAVIQNSLAITPNVNQSTGVAAGYNALLINVTETQVGTGAKNLINAGVGGSVKFSVDNGGNVYSLNNIVANLRLGVGLGVGVAPGALFHLSNGNSFSTSAAFNTNGFGFRLDGNTFNSSASGSTIAATTINSIGAPTLTANNATILTTASTLRIAGAPIAGAGITITNPYALEVASGNVLFNGNLNVTGVLNIGNGIISPFFKNTATQTTVAGSTSGQAVFSEPEQGSSYKKVIVVCANLNGTASYTFPTAFINTPAIVTTSGPAASVVTSVSGSSITITGSSTSGVIELIGY